MIGEIEPQLRIEVLEANKALCKRRLSLDCDSKVGKVKQILDVECCVVLTSVPAPMSASDSVRRYITALPLFKRFLDAIIAT